MSADVRPRHLAAAAAPDFRAADAWDAATAANIGELVARYLADNPPPPGTRTGDDWRRYARYLNADARVRAAVARLHS